MEDQQYKCFCNNESAYSFLIRVGGLFARLVLNLGSVSLVAIGL